MTEFVNKEEAVKVEVSYFHLFLSICASECLIFEFETIDSRMLRPILTTTRMLER
jgi:hypothetical protein